MAVASRERATVLRERFALRVLFAFLSLLFLGLAWLAIADARFFLSHSERGAGQVVSLHGKDESCRRADSGPYDCTKYVAWARVNSKNRGQLEVLLDAGSTSGHGQPTSLARYRVGDSIPVIFDPDHPATAFRDSLREVWGISALLLVLAAVFIYCFFRGRFPFER